MCLPYDEDYLDAPSEAWDCNPEFLPIDEGYDLDLDEEDSTSDWQVIALDRFGDRLVCDKIVQHWTTFR